MLVAYKNATIHKQQKQQKQHTHALCDEEPDGTQVSNITATLWPLLHH